MSWKIILKQITKGQEAFLNYMIKHHGKEYALDMGINEMNPNGIFASLQEELNVNEYEMRGETDSETLALYTSMNEQILEIMDKHYKNYLDMA